MGRAFPSAGPSPAPRFGGVGGVRRARSRNDWGDEGPKAGLAADWDGAAALVCCPRGAARVGHPASCRLRDDALNNRASALTPGRAVRPPRVSWRRAGEFGWVRQRGSQLLDCGCLGDSRRGAFSGGSGRFRARFWPVCRAPRAAPTDSSARSTEGSLITRRRPARTLPVHAQQLRRRRGTRAIRLVQSVWAMALDGNCVCEVRARHSGAE